VHIYDRLSLSFCENEQKFRQAL